MPLRVYLDTSILGAICDPGPEERLAATRRLLDGCRAGRWEGTISTLVLVEIRRAPETVRRRIEAEVERVGCSVLEESRESRRLAHAYLAARALPRTQELDARHVALATVNGVSVVVSWNFRHMVNVERRRRINGVSLREGRPMIDIVSPWEVIGGDEEA